MPAQADLNTAQGGAFRARTDSTTVQSGGGPRNPVRGLHRPRISSPGPCNTRSMSYSWRAAFAGLGLALLAGCATTAAPAPLADAAPGQRAWAAACAENDSWDKPGPPFRVYGDTYYVGTCGITALLVASPDGHTLIDSGTDKGAEIVLANIRALGFDPADVKTVLMSHEHFDHVGGMARIQAVTGATIVASAPAAAVLASGRTAADDPQAASDHPPFVPVTGRIDVLTLQRRATLRQAGFIALATPGHTPGALSWTWPACESGVCKQIVYVDSLNPISADGYRFSDNPGLVRDFRSGIAEVRATPCDIVIAPHPGATALRARLIGERPLVDQGGCKAFAATVEERLDRRLATEAGGG